jgi:hypothetical protein
VALTDLELDSRPEVDTVIPSMGPLWLGWRSAFLLCGQRLLWTPVQPWGVTLHSGHMDYTIGRFEHPTPRFVACCPYWLCQANRLSKRWSAEVQ